MLPGEVHAEVAGQRDGSVLLGGMDVGWCYAEVGGDGGFNVRDVDDAD